MRHYILTINAGSSSLKFGLFDAGEDKNERVLFGQVNHLQDAFALRIYGNHQEEIHKKTWARNQLPQAEDIVRYVLDWIHHHLGHMRVFAIGHRIVHGGMRYADPVLIDDEVVDYLATLSGMAPLHEIPSIQAIRTFRTIAPDLPQVACFDTAFHQPFDKVDNYYGLPLRFARQGIRKYGFHGLSYEYLCQQLRGNHPDLAKGKVILAHLGNGASLCAVNDGKSMSSTMGFSSLDGLVMGSRCGSLDPGVLLYLQKEMGMDIQEVEKLLYFESGLLGLSGLSHDIRDLLSSADANAKLAVEVFLHQIMRHIGVLMMTLGGLDAIVFSGGIGEHQAQVRAMVCQKLHWLGVALDTQANTENNVQIQTRDSKIKVLVIPTNEEYMLACHTVRVLGSSALC